jgi:ABC-type Fe3+/spermidine/putrescine transport system ATPase subunit
MRDGQMVQVGTPAEVYERPNCRFSAEFLGAANIMPVVVGPNGQADLPGLGSVRVVVAAAGPMLLALRPERLRLDGTEGENRLSGVLQASMYAGETLTHTVRLANGSVVRVTQALHDGLTAMRPIGSEVTVSWAPAAGVLLPL